MANVEALILSATALGNAAANWQVRRVDLI
jgi:hypothetical protein